VKCFATFHELKNFLRLLANQGGRFSLQNIRMSELFERRTVRQSVIADGLPMYPVIYKLQGYWLNQVLGIIGPTTHFLSFAVSSYSLSLFLLIPSLLPYPLSLPSPLSLRAAASHLPRQGKVHAQANGHGPLRSAGRAAGAELRQHWQLDVARWSSTQSCSGVGPRKVGTLWWSSAWRGDGVMCGGV